MCETRKLFKGFYCNIPTTYMYRGFSQHLLPRIVSHFFLFFFLLTLFYFYFILEMRKAKKSRFIEKNIAYVAEQNLILWLKSNSMTRQARKMRTMKNFQIDEKFIVVVARLKWHSRRCVKVFFRRNFIVCSEFLCLQNFANIRADSNERK